MAPDGRDKARAAWARKLAESVRASRFIDFAWAKKLAESQKGQMSILFCIILLSMVAFSGMLVDAARFLSGEALVKKAVETSAKSLLAGYSSRLEEGYGIFAFDGGPSRADEMQKAVKNYIEKNLMIKDEELGEEKGLRLYDFRVEKVSVAPVYNLTENHAIKGQILEYMKYRAPAEYILNFLEKLNVFKELGKMAEAYKLKTGIDKVMSKLDKAQQRLKISIDGDGSPGKPHVNGFDTDGWSAELNKFKSLCDSLSNARRALADLINSFAAMGDATELDAEAAAGMAQAVAAMEADIAAKEAYALAVWSNLSSAMTESFLKPNMEALSTIQSIIEAGKAAVAAIEELAEFIKNNFEGIPYNEESAGAPVFRGEFVSTLSGEIEKFRRLIEKGEEAASLIEDLNRNILTLKEMAGKLAAAKSWIYGYNYEPAAAAVMVEELLSLARGYSKPAYYYDKPEKTAGAADPRKDAEDAAEKLLALAGGDDVNYMDRGIKKEELPSHAKVESNKFGEEDRPFLFEGDISCEGEAQEGLRLFDGDPASFAGNLDLFDEEGLIQGNSLDLISGVADLLSRDFTALLDDLYINEYIIDTFKCATGSKSNTKDGSDTANGIDTENGAAGGAAGGSADADKAAATGGRGAFYDREIEYILHGSPSQNTNSMLTTAQILLMRFGLNTLHVYTDPQKRQLAYGTATTIAGWWTGGAGIPLISNLIMCGWGLGEAALDLQELMNGGRVPVYKSKGDWKLDIGSIAKGGPKTGEEFYFSYEDYLRILLLLTEEDKKLGRIGDLIQLNSVDGGHELVLNNYNTCVRVEAEVSMNCIFLNKYFIPGRWKTEDGRKRIKVVVYEGY